MSGRDESSGFTIPLQDCASAQARVGGKAVGLAKLLGVGLPVPGGFAVTTDAYFESVTKTVLGEKIRAVLDDGYATAETKSKRISALFSTAAVSPEVRHAVAESYQRLCGARGDVPVAVRSSATAEDLADASFAGQQDTYLWVSGIDAVTQRLSECWASLFTARAIEYRSRMTVHVDNLAMAVVIQEMVDAQAAGVMMTLDPASGDRSTIYLESAYGLGESVVRGEVSPDRYSIDKTTVGIRFAHTGDKATMWKPSADRETTQVEVPAELRTLASITDDEARELARIGVRVEHVFGTPMDIEWAVGTVDPQSGTDRRPIFMLQARPETVWSTRAEDTAALPDGWDVLDNPSDPHLHWTTSNLGEACPGVLTPLSWSVWAPVVERSPREAAFAIGALTRQERRLPTEVRERYVRIFKGRPAMQVEFMAMLGDRMPGTTGQKTISGLFGHVPPGMQFRPSVRRYPVVAWRLPLSFITIGRRIAQLSESTEHWWRQRILDAERADLAQALELFHEARTRLDEAVRIQSISQSQYDSGALGRPAGCGGRRRRRRPGRARRLRRTRDGCRRRYLQGGQRRSGPRGCAVGARLSRSDGRRTQQHGVAGERRSVAPAVGGLPGERAGRRSPSPAPSQIQRAAGHATRRPGTLAEGEAARSPGGAAGRRRAAAPAGSAETGIPAGTGCGARLGAPCRPPPCRTGGAA
jgi:rifampicin phosphotransferase